MPSDPRVSITFLSAPRGRDWLDGMVTAKVRRSDVIRAALQVAAKHQPEVEEAIRAIEESRRF